MDSERTINELRESQVWYKKNRHSIETDQLEAFYTKLVALESNLSKPVYLSHLFFLLGNVQGQRMMMEYKKGCSQAFIKLRNSELEFFLKSLDILRDHDGLVVYPYEDKTHISAIYTNIASLYSKFGRVVESVNMYSKALNWNPNDIQTIAHLGATYAELSHFTCGKEKLNLLHAARANLTLALNNKEYVDETWSENTKYFKAILDSLPNTTVRNKNRKTNLKIFFSRVFKRCTREGKYLSWCKKTQLFLNLDFGLYPIENHFDTLHLHKISADIHEGGLDRAKYIFQMFNIAKQEYASNRFLLYESILTKYKTHFSDKNNEILETADYVSYSLSTEKLKQTFRSTYSIFDKIATILNRYFQIGLPHQSVSFNKIFSKDEKAPKNVKEFLKTLQKNPRLEALSSLRAELFEKNIVSFEPQAPSDIKESRQYAEHKFLAVTIEIPSKEFGEEKLVKYVYREELEIITIDLFKKVRAALYYLCQSIEIHERQNNSNQFSAPIFLDKFPYDLKR